MVYLVACVPCTMGPASGNEEHEPLLGKTHRLLEKAGYQVVFPDSLDDLHCSQPLTFKGYAKQADDRRDELFAAPFQASRDGLDPIYCDTSPRTPRLAQGLDDPRLQTHDPMRFIRSHLLDRLKFTPRDRPIAVYATCSTQHFDESQVLIDLAGRYTREVVIPEGIHCYGFADDKGSTTPELNAHSPRSLKDAVWLCKEGVLVSCTCEIGLNEYGGIGYRGVVHPVDWVTQVKDVPQQGEQLPHGYPPGHAPQKRRVAPLALFILRQTKRVLRRRQPTPEQAKNPSLSTS